jgi:transposase
MPDSILSDQLWQRIEPLLPQQKKPRHVQYAGRKPTDPRKVMTGILFVLRTGIPWKSLPATSDFPTGHTYRRKLIEWQQQGGWQRLWQNLLAELQAKQELDWQRGVVDSSSVRAGHAGEKTGKNPVDRGKPGSKHHILVEGRGIPLSIGLTGANRHDITQLMTLVEGIPGRRGRPRQKPKKVQGDRGYDSEPHRQKLKKRYRAVISKAKHEAWKRAGENEMGGGEDIVLVASIQETEGARGNQQFHA